MDASKCRLFQAALKGQWGQRKYAKKSLPASSSAVTGRPTFWVSREKEIWARLALLVGMAPFLSAASQYTTLLFGTEGKIFSPFFFLVPL